MKRPIKKETSDILCIGKFWEASENRQIPYQSVSGPFSILLVSASLSLTVSETLKTDFLESRPM